MHTNILQAGLISLFLTLFCSLAVAGEPEISQKNYKAISNSKIFHSFAQKELEFKIADYKLGHHAGTGSGSSLIGAMMFTAFESSTKNERQRKGNKDVAYFNKLLDDYDFRKHFDDRLSKLISENLIERGLFDIKSYKLKKNTYSILLQNIEKSEHGTLLLLKTNYYFNEDFRTIIVDTVINIQKSKELEKKQTINIDDDEEEEDNEFDLPPPPIYNSRVMYQSKSMPLEVDYKKYWSSENRLKMALEESIEILPEMIVDNLENSIEKRREGESDYWEISINNFRTAVSGELLQTKGDRVIVRAEENDSEVYVSLNKNDRYVEIEEGDEDF